MDFALPHIPRLTIEQWFNDNSWQGLHTILGEYTELIAAKKAHKLNKTNRQYGIMEKSPGKWCVVSRLKGTTLAGSGF